MGEIVGLGQEAVLTVWDAVFGAVIAAWLAGAVWWTVRARAWRMGAGWDRGVSAARLLGLAAGVWLCQQVGAVVGLGLSGFGGGSGVPTASGLASAIVVGGIVAFAGIAGAMLLGVRFGRCDGAAVRQGVVGFLVVTPISLGVGFVVSALSSALGAPPDVLAHETLRMLVEDPWSVGGVALMVGVVTVVPAMEEVVYRGFVQGAIRRATGSPMIGVLFGSVVFVVMHVGAADLLALYGLFVLSVGLGVLVERTKSVWPAVVAHGLFNGMNVGLALLL